MTDQSYENALARYRALVDRFPELKVKGKTNPYTSMNGNMFSFLDKFGRLCLRLPKKEREAFIAEHGTEPVVQYGSVMKEYVEVPETLAQSEALLDACFHKCLDYARSLPAKPTRKPD